MIRFRRVPALNSLMATFGSEGITLPDDIDSNAVTTETGPNNEALVTVNETIKDVELDVTGDVTFNGGKIKEFEIEIKPINKLDTVSVTFNNKIIKGVLEAKVATNIKFINKIKDLAAYFSKNDDVITVGNSGEGKFKNATFDLGKKGTDKIVFDAKKLRGIVIENFDKKDTIEYNGEIFTKKDFNNGATIKGVEFE